MDFRIYIQGLKPEAKIPEVLDIEKLQSNMRKGYYFSPTITGSYMGIPIKRLPTANFNEEDLVYQIIQKNFPGFDEKGILSYETRRSNTEYGHRPRHTILEDTIKDFDIAIRKVREEGLNNETIGDIVLLTNARITLAKANLLNREVVVEEKPKP